MTAFFGRGEASPWGRDLRGAVQTLPRLVLGDVRPALFVFAAASGLLLLITCINVASLLLVRGVARLANLFVPFYTTKPNGSGIGLALSRQIAEAHGGALNLRNRTRTAGCEARLSLPL